MVAVTGSKWKSMMMTMSTMMILKLWKKERGEVMDMTKVITWHKIQWGPKFGTCLDFEWLKVYQMTSGLDFECHSQSGDYPIKLFTPLDKFTNAP